MAASSRSFFVNCAIVSVPIGYLHCTSHNNSKREKTPSSEFLTLGSNSIIVNEKTWEDLGLKQQRFTNSTAVWVVLKCGLRYLSTEDNDSVWCTRLVHVANNQLIPDETVIVSEDFLLNFFGEETLKVFIGAEFKEGKPKLTLVNDHHDGEIAQPPPATKVVVSSHQLGLEDSMVDRLLLKYFSYPRYLCTGDIFSVHVSETFLLDLLNCANLDTVYFKVTEILGGQAPSTESAVYTVDSSVAIAQTSAFQGFLPSRNIPVCYKPSLESLLAEDKFTSLLQRSHSLVPPSFDEAFNTLCQWVKPFFFNPDKMKGIKLIPVFLVTGQNGSGKTLLIQALSQHFGVQYERVDCASVEKTAPGKAEGKIKAIFSRLKTLTPCILHLSDIEALCQDTESKTDVRVISCFEQQVKQFSSKWPVVIIATSHNTKNISPEINNLFLDKVSVVAPNSQQRESIVEWIVWCSNGTIDSQVLQAVASQTSGFAFRDLQVLVALAYKEKYKRLKKENAVNGFLLSDFSRMIGIMHKAYSESIGAPKVPSVTWKDVGGLESLKKEIMQSLRSNLFSTGLKRSGLLLHGPPGTGKTLLAKAVATQCNRTFLSVKGPELLNMYVGQSEQNVRDLFELAKVAAPCIIFFDELDSLAPKRGRSGDSGGVMDSVVSQLLAEMDNLGGSGDIFILGATNRPDLIDPALLRPGRLDKLLFVGPCEDRPSQMNVLTAVTQKLHLADDVDMEEVTSQLPASVTGAQISALCSAAWLSSARQLINSGGHKESTDVIVNKHHFISAIRTVFSQP